MIYADFETLATSPSCDQNDTRIYQEHTACSYGYIVVDWTGKIIIKDFYRGEDAAHKFLSSIIHHKQAIEEHIERGGSK